MLIVTKIFPLFCWFFYMNIKSCTSTCRSRDMKFKIFNGTDANQYQKHVVQVEVKAKGNAFTGQEYVCGGVIIQPDMIATASFCIYNDKGPLKPKMIKVIAGSPYLYSRSPTAQVRAVNQLLIHQYYKYGEDAYGIAVLKLKEPLIENGRTVQHLDALEKPLRVSDSCVILGWGNIDCYKSKGKHKPNMLQHTKLSIISSERCEKLAGKKLGVKIICAQDESGNSHPCTGDTGSPLICHGQVAGILLNGHNASEQPSIFNSFERFYIELHMIRYVTRDLKILLKNNVSRPISIRLHVAGFLIASLYFSNSYISRVLRI